MEFSEAKERMETALREIQKDGESTVVGREDGCVIVRSREEEVALWPTDFVEEGSDEIGDPHAEETPNELPGPGQKKDDGAAATPENTSAGGNTVTGDAGEGTTPQGASEGTVPGNAETTGDAGAQQSADDAQKAAAAKADAEAKAKAEAQSKSGSTGSKK